MIAGLVALASAFNLVCTGESRFGDMSKNLLVPVTGQFTTVYRVDLASERYCAGACTETKPIMKVTGTVIYFQLEDKGNGADAMEYVNRESGAYVFRLRTLPMVTMNTGKCERADFTGFPARKF